MNARCTLDQGHLVGAELVVGITVSITFAVTVATYSRSVPKIQKRALRMVVTPIGK